MTICVPVAAFLAGMLCHAALADTVVRRGQAGEVQGLASFDDSGVTVRSDTGARIFVPWDKVRHVTTDRPAPGLDTWLDIAEDLWRARSRLERGDATLAEPLFGELFARFRGQTHETALVAAEGLLRCRLARGAQAEAVIPALETTRLYRAGLATSSYSLLPPVLDDSTELCVQLAPFWIVDQHLVSLNDDLERYDAQADRVVEAMAYLLHASVRSRLGAASLPRREMNDLGHDGVTFLQLVIDAAYADADLREAAHELILARLQDLKPWARAWCRMALGQGLLQEDDPAARDEGLLHLAYLPARHASHEPFLAGLALGVMSAELERRGDSGGAASINAELKRRFPGHPLLLRRGSELGARTALRSLRS